MKQKASLFTAIILSGLFSLSAMAMPPGPEPGGRHYGMGHMQRMAEALDLTAEQKVKVDAIFEKHRKAMEPLKEQGQATWKKMQDTDPAELTKKDIDKISKERGKHAEAVSRESLQTKAEFYRVLTAEQREQLKQMKEEMREKRKERFEQYKERRQDQRQMPAN